jgi:hypothetical protein
MAEASRRSLAVVLFVVAAFCAYQAVAAQEAPESAWIYWLIDGVVGLAAVLGIAWLLRPRRNAV